MIFSATGSNCVFTLDVEEWFHILDLPTTPPVEMWPFLEGRVESNFRKLMDILAEQRVKTTCFFLGWVAAHYPALVREAVSRGHEIASHGYEHELVHRMTQNAFRADIDRSKKLLEDISGNLVLGYRAPGFSGAERVPWFFDEIVRAGYRYDSSVFPAEHGHGGTPHGNVFPHVVHTAIGDLVEFPISTATLMGKRLCFFGGGYLRIFPIRLIDRMATRVNNEGRPVIFYVHPREIDPLHPRLQMSLKRRFRSYVGLRSTEGKIRAILRDRRFATFEQLLSTLIEAQDAVSSQDINSVVPIAQISEPEL